MSTDYSFYCEPCGRSMHMGQRMGGLFSLGYGSRDTGGALAVGRWAMKHHHNSTLRWMDGDCVPECATDWICDKCQGWGGWHQDERCDLPKGECEACGGNGYLPEDERF